MNNMYSNKMWRDHLNPSTIFEQTVVWIRPALASLGYFQDLCTRDDIRSEEHTSELQSPYSISYAPIQKESQWGKGGTDPDDGLLEDRGKIQVISPLIISVHAI